MNRKLLTFLKNGTTTLLITIFVLSAVSLLPIPNNFKLLVVNGGSMEPELKPGSVILVLPKKDIISATTSLPKFQEGEIIAYLSGKETVTHRIVAVEQNQRKIFYQTKGDANPGADIKKVPEEKVLGKVIFSLPYLGYPISFAKTKTGYILLIIIPATTIIYGELLQIKNEIQKIIVKKKCPAI